MASCPVQHAGGLGEGQDLLARPSRHPRPWIEMENIEEELDKQVILDKRLVDFEDVLQIYLDSMCETSINQTKDVKVLCGILQNRDGTPALFEQRTIGSPTPEVAGSAVPSAKQKSLQNCRVSVSITIDIKFIYNIYITSYTGTIVLNVLAVNYD